MTTPNDPNNPVPGGDSPAATPPGYGTPSGYGAPGGYGAPQGYGAPGYPPPGAAPYGGAQLAGWGSRMLSGLIDYGPVVLGDILVQFGSGIGYLIILVGLGWTIYNKIQEGKTGQSTGKKTAGIRLLREADGQVVGAGLAIGRWLLHIVDGLPCFLGYLWPLWDKKKQTFADKIVSTIVIQA